MFKAVFDTNILVSSVFWDKGNPHQVVSLALDGRIQAFTSVAILKELETVLRRDFGEPEDMVQRQIALIIRYSKLVFVNVSLDVVKEDPDDNRILECAVACGADFIITGDRHLLKLGSFGKVRIITAKAFVEMVGG